MPRVRFTMLAITINTNRAATTEEQEQWYTSQLAAFFQNVLSHREAWRSLIFIEPGFSAVDHIDVSAIGIERGPKRHRIHAHFVVTIQHHGKIIWKGDWRKDGTGAGTEKAWQNLVNKYVKYTRGSKVNIQLINARQLNYTSKYSGSFREIASIGPQQSVKF